MSEYLAVFSSQKYWKPCELFVLSQLYIDNSFTVKEIGKILGRCAAGIVRKAYKLGMSRCPDKNTRNKFLGIYYDEITALHIRGLTKKEIAKELNTDEKTVGRVMRKLGLRLDLDKEKIQQNKVIEERRQQRNREREEKMKLREEWNLQRIREREAKEKFKEEYLQQYHQQATKAREDRKKLRNEIKIFESNQIYNCKYCRSSWKSPCNNCLNLELSIQMELEPSSEFALEEASI